MKTILVPTDFSDNANRALDYACNLALQLKAKIILMNAFQSPASTSNVMINFTDKLTIMIKYDDYDPMCIGMDGWKIPLEDCYWNEAEGDQ